MNKQLIVITGPTCGGKTTLKETLLSLAGGSLMEAVTTTTRRARPGESDSKAYRFRTKEKFAELVREDKLLEWVRYDGHYYGIEVESLNALKASEASGVAVVTVEGLTALEAWCKDNDIEIIRVLATAPMEELLRRLECRRDRSEKVIRQRREKLMNEASMRVDLSQFDWVVDPMMSDALMRIASANRA